ncbi:crossover junction endodeoxyribonuclease RuvC [Desulfohalobium retbaense]|uniref:Crossover junction endodeoxyribonuclease RuvC n=1 Tax=Desulfohalobium retbaense (strain ATCC 49708 / DSM 5692 / JCM 16813 / HR100) TaxID=485915 RepID=C8X3N4_DESRD|nr:crossover junction endodeoxyribonuclease RuvC [Desulfohalobium retbaense DSM 5692]
MDTENGLVVLGLDPGSRCTGFGVVRERSGQLTLLETGTIRPKSSEGLSLRLGALLTQIAVVIDRWSPHEAAIEDVFVARNTASALKLGQARGAALAACGSRGLDVSEYAPTVVKKTLVGAGRAEKSQVAFMVGQMLGCKPQWAEDSSDALAVALCHCNQRRLSRLTAAGR